MIWAVAYLLWLTVGGLGYVVLLNLARHPSTVGAGPPPLAIDPLGALGISLAMAPFCSLFNGVMTAAMNRVIYVSEPDRFGYLRLGAAELRQWVVTLAAWAAIAASWVVGAVAVGAIVALIGHGAGLGPNGSVAIGFAALLLGASLGLALSIPFGMAAAITFEARRFAFREAFALTGRHFWRLLAARCLSLLPVGVVFSAYLFGFFAIENRAAPPGQGPVIPFFEWGKATVSATAGGYLTADRLEIFALRAVVAAICWPLITTPFAAVHRYLVQRTADGVKLEDVFS